jgi:hypothetical protein
VYFFNPKNMHGHGDLVDVYEFTGHQSADGKFEHDGVAVDIVCHPLDADNIVVNLVTLDKARYKGCETGLLITYPSATWVRQKSHYFAGRAMTKEKIARQGSIIKAKNKALLAARDSPPVTTLIAFKRAISPNMFHVATPGRDPSQLEPESEALAMYYEIKGTTHQWSLDLCMLSTHVTYVDSEKQVLESDATERKDLIARKLATAKARAPDPAMLQLSERLEALQLENERLAVSIGFETTHVTHLFLLCCCCCVAAVALRCCVTLLLLHFAVAAAAFAFAAAAGKTGRPRRSSASAG